MMSVQSIQFNFQIIQVFFSFDTRITEMFYTVARSVARPRSRDRPPYTGIIPFSCPRMFSGESCLRCRVCFVCFEGWFFERVIKNIIPVYC